MSRLNLDTVDVRAFNFADLAEVVKIHRQAFSHDNRNEDEAREWILCNYMAYPRMQYFVADLPVPYQNIRGPIGYVLYMAKGGFAGGNPEHRSVVELEQIGVRKDFQGMGVGTKLARESFKEIIRYFRSRGLSIKALEVTTGTSNEAQQLYRKVFGAEVAAIVPQLYREDEAVMLARFDEEKLDKFLSDEFGQQE